MDSGERWEVKLIGESFGLDCCQRSRGDLFWVEVMCVSCERNFLLCLATFGSSLFKFEASSGCNFQLPLFLSFSLFAKASVFLGLLVCLDQGRSVSL